MKDSCHRLAARRERLGRPGRPEAPAHHREALRGRHIRGDVRGMGCVRCEWRLRRSSSVRLVLGPRPPAGDQCQLVGRQGLSALADAADRQVLPPVVVGGVGVPGAGGNRRAESLRVDDLDRSGELPGNPVAQIGRSDGVSTEDGSGGFVSARRVRPARHARQCVGVGGGLSARKLSRRAHGRQRMDCRRPLFVARASRWLLVFR